MAEVDFRELPDIDGTQDEMADAMERTEQVHGISELAMEAGTEMLEAMTGNPDAFGIKTGYPSLDRLLGGFQPGQLITIGSRTGVGKTAFALNLALNSASSGSRVLFATLATPGKEIARRLTCSQAMVNIDNFRSGRISPQEMANINEAVGELGKLDILVDDTPRMNVKTLAASCGKMAEGATRPLVIVDFLQLMRMQDSKAYRGNRAVELADIMAELKVMARELGIAMVVLSQLNRPDYGKPDALRPRPWQLTGSAAIEQMSDIVMLLDKSETEAEAERDDRPDFGITRVILAKNNSGPNGEVDLMFLPSACKFYEMQ